MGQKNYTEVLIDGTIYTLGGTEGEAYLQKVAVYLNDKIGQIRKQSGFSKQSAEYQALMIELNIADDYFKEQERADILAEQKAAMEKDAYSLKHELITTQMKLESDQEELERFRKDGNANALAEQLARVKEAAERETAEARRAQETAERETAEARRAQETAERETAEARRAQETAERETAEAKQAQETAERETAEARQAQETAEQQAQKLREELDSVKGELEQLKAIHAAAAAVAGRVPRR